MKLDPKEARLIAELRGTPTGKVVVSKFGGEIKSIRTEIDAELADKARGQGSPWSAGHVPRGTLPGETDTKPKTVKISEPHKSPLPLAGKEEIRTQE